MLRMDARLYLVVTPSLCAGGVLATVEAALDGGVDAVQLRDKDCSDDDFLRMARALVALCRERGVPCILNDRDWLLEASGAAGVHLGEDDTSPEGFRARFGDGPLLGISTHDRAEVAAAAGRGASNVGLGPMFATGTKDLVRTPRGAALVRETLGATTLPVFPIGGIHAGNAPELIAAGATRLAVSSAICAAPDPSEAARGLRTLLT